MTLQPHQQRVVDEKDELVNKITKLSSFISSNAVYPTLDVEEQVRLALQLRYMRSYWEVLAERIVAFGEGA